MTATARPRGAPPGVSVDKRRHFAMADARREMALIERWTSLTPAEKRELYDDLPEGDQKALRDTFATDLWRTFR